MIFNFPFGNQFSDYGTTKVNLLYMNTVYYKFSLSLRVKPTTHVNYFVKSTKQTISHQRGVLHKFLRLSFVNCAQSKD